MPGNVSIRHILIFEASQLAGDLGISYFGHIFKPHQAVGSPTRKLQADCLKLAGLGLLKIFAKICI